MPSRRVVRFLFIKHFFPKFGHFQHKSKAFCGELGTRQRGEPLPVPTPMGTERRIVGIPGRGKLLEGLFRLRQGGSPIDRSQLPSHHSFG